MPSLPTLSRTALATLAARTTTTALIAVTCAALMPMPAGAQAAPTRAGGAASAAGTGLGTEALQSCERAARQSLATKGAPAAELRFIGAPTELPGLVGDGRVLLQGSGSWRDGGVLRRFDYSCNVDPRAPEAVGLVMRDTTPVPLDDRPARPEVEPDLSHLSPAACESAAAAALKKRWPMVAEINFDPATRRLSQDSPSRADLRGRGRALPAPGSPILHFGFDCQIDPRNGRVLETTLSG